MVGWRNTRLCATLCLSLMMVIVAPIEKSEAFSIGNPFAAVGRALGDVARGVGNIFGQGIAGLASPTINAFSDDVNKVLAERLVQADKMLQARVAQVDEVMQKNINNLDGIIQDKIQKFDALLDQKIGAVDIVATKAVQSAEDSLVAVLRFGTALVLVACIIFVLSKIIINRSARQVLSSQTVVAGMATIVIACAGALGASYLIQPPAGARVERLSQDFQKAAITAYRLGELNDAAVYAKQLTVIDPTNVAYAAFQKVAEIQRDILYRPTSLKSVPGANELLPKVRRLSQFALDPSVRSGNDPLSRFVAEQTSATSAVVLWQLSQTKGTDREALCNAADAIGEFRKDIPTKDPKVVSDRATPFTWLAYSYLRWGEISYRNASTLFKCPDGADFAATAKALDPILEAFDGAVPPDTIAHVVIFNRAATRYFSQAAPLYTTLVVRDAAWQVTSDPATKAAHKSERDKIAERLIGLWSQFSIEIRNNTAVATNDIALASIGLPAALALRAQYIRDADPAARSLAQGTCASIIAELQANSAAAKAKYENLRPANEPAASSHSDAIYRLATIFPSSKVQNMLCPDQVDFDAKLWASEKALVVAATKAINDETKARMELSRDPILNNLAICVAATSTTPVAPWIGHPMCSDADFGKQLDSGTSTARLPFDTKPYSDWLASDVVPNSLELVRYAMVR